MMQMSGLFHLKRNLPRSTEITNMSTQKWLSLNSFVHWYKLRFDFCDLPVSHLPECWQRCFCLECYGPSTGGPTWRRMYRQVSNIRRTKSQHLKYSCTVLRLSLPNPLKPDVQSTGDALTTSEWSTILLPTKKFYGSSFLGPTWILAPKQSLTLRT